MTREYPYNHSFRCNKETQAMLDYCLECTNYNKSFLIRECIELYFDSICKAG